jgi:hypothetical protein
VLFACLPQFIHPEPVVLHSSMPLYQVFYTLSSLSFYHHFLFYIGLLANALLLNRVVIKHQLLLKNTNLVASVLVLLAVLVPNSLTLNPIVLANVFLILALDKTLTLYNQPKVYHLCFQVGFLIGIAAHFYLPAALLLLLFFVALLVIRTFVWRDWIIAILGFLVPFCYSWTYFFWNDALNDYYALFTVLPKTFPHALSQVKELQQLALAVISTVGLVAVYREMSHATVRHKNLLTVVLCYFGLSLFMLFMRDMMLADLYVMCWIPLSIMLSVYLQSLRKKWLAEVSFLLLVLLGIFNFAAAVWP